MTMQKFASSSIAIGVTEMRVKDIYKLINLPFYIKDESLITVDATNIKDAIHFYGDDRIISVAVHNNNILLEVK